MRSLVLIAAAAGALLSGSPSAPRLAATPSSAIFAHPPVEGAAGPFAKVRVVLTRERDVETDPFAGTLTAGAVRMTLPPPDEPVDLFLFRPKAVMFIPVDRSRINAVVILYDSSQIGPQHGTDHRALVYRIRGDRAVRLRAIETRLEVPPTRPRCAPA